MGRNSKYYGIRFDRRSQNFGFHMIARSQLIANDRRTFCDLRSAIRDRLRSYGNQQGSLSFWLVSVQIFVANNFIIIREINSQCR